MAKFTKEQLDEILRKHQMWIDGDAGGERANLSNADLTNADLYCSNLAYADLSGANLSNAKLTNAVLTSAILTGANLAELDSLLVASGNMVEIKTIQCETWPVAYSATHMQIGCQLHKLDEWWSFSDERISRMSVDALTWWKKWKPMLKMFIDASPAI